jgi:hypothetical protein
VQVEIGIYQPNFTTKQGTLIAKTNLFTITTGRNYSPLLSSVTLPSGIYIFAIRYLVPTMSYFTYRCISRNNQIGFVISNLHVNFTNIIVPSSTSLPTTIPFPNSAFSVANSAEIFYSLILGQRILPTI